MGSLSDAIASASSTEAWKEYHRRKEQELHELWEGGTEEQREFARRIVKLYFELV